MTNKTFETYQEFLRNANISMFEQIKRLSSLSIISGCFTSFDEVEVVSLRFNREKLVDADDYLFQLHVRLEDVNVEEYVLLAADFLPDMKVRFESEPFNFDHRIPSYLKGHRIFGFEGSWDEAEAILREVEEIVAKNPVANEAE